MFFNREELRCLVGFVEERGFTYVSCAKGMLAYTGHLCTTLLLSILAFALLVMVTGELLFVVCYAWIPGLLLDLASLL